MVTTRCLSKQSSGCGFTLIELILVIFVAVILIGMIMPHPTRNRRATRTACINNLKQVGIGFRLYANDNSGAFPMQCETAGYTNMPSEAWRHFAAAGNEISNPKVLICPDDITIDRSLYDFSGFNDNKFTSYFVGVHAAEDSSNFILSGDADIYLNKKLMSKNAVFPLISNYVWGKRHKLAGNLLFADGSADGVTSNGLVRAVYNQTRKANNAVGNP